MRRVSTYHKTAFRIFLIIAGVLKCAAQGTSDGPPVPCATFPAGVIPFVSIYYVSEPGTLGERMVVGTMGGSAPLEMQNRVPLPTAVGQRYCDPVQLAPGLWANAYVPTAAERSGNYSSFTGSLLDPLACTNTSGGQVCTSFPANIIPASRQGFLFAWRIAAGALGDAVGDAPSGAPDLLAVSATTLAGSLRLVAHFVPGTLNASTTLVAFGLDTDRNPATGHPGMSSGGVSDASVLGTDYNIVIGPDEGGRTARVNRATGGINAFSNVGTFPATLTGNRVETVIPLSLLQDDGNMNFKVISFSRIDAATTTSIQDRITEIDRQPGRIEAPILRITATPPAITPGTPYSYTMTGAGGTGGYVWSATGLPSWLTLSSAGILAGSAPAIPGPVTFTAILRDSSSTATSQSFTLAQAPAIGGPATLPPAVPGTPYTYTFTVTGGTGPYIWSATGLPTWLTLSAAGVLSGTPPLTANASSFTVTVRDTPGVTAMRTLALPVTLTVTSPATLPSVPAGIVFTYNLTATGGSGNTPSAPYRWTMTGNPNWLMLTSAGTLSGSPPPGAARATFTVTVTDSANNTASKTLNLPLSLAITSASPLPVAEISSMYRQTFAAAGGSGTGYTWTATALPSWLTLTPAGVLTGTVPTTATTTTINVSVADSVGTTTAKMFSLPVALALTSTSPLPTANPGASYTYTFRAAGGSGTYSWTATGLPSWLTLSTAGVLTGTPPAGASAASITVRVSDTLDVSTSRTFTVPVGATVTIAGSTTLPNGAPLSPYSYTFKASGGSGDGYTWVATGLPAWLTLSPTGLLNGTPPSDASGTVTLNIRVIDLNGSTASGQFRLTIVALPAPVLRTLEPTSALAGGLPVRLTVDGSNFSTAAVAQWNGSPLPTQYVSATRLTATLSAALLANVESANITVSNQSVVSNSLAFNVTGPAPAGLSLSQTGLTFQAVQNGPAPRSRTFLVSSAGAPVAFSVTPTTLSGGQRWLVPTSLSGNTDSSPTVTVGVDPTGLMPGDYYGQLRITAPGVQNPQVVSVALTVAGPTVNPGPTVDPIGLVFVSLPSRPPGPRAITIQNPNPAALTFTSTAVFPDEDRWFTHTPSSGSVARGAQVAITVQPTGAALTPGVHQAQLALQFSDGSRRLVTLVLVVPRVTGVNNSLASRATGPNLAGCTPKELIPVFVLLATGSGFNVTVGTPVPVEVVAVDDCGDLLDTGSVVATFTNGDPDLPLKPQNASLSADAALTGRWSETWIPRNAQTANLKVTVTALSRDRALKGVTDVGGVAEDTLLTPLIEDGAVVGAAAYNGIPAPGTIIAISGAKLADAVVQGDIVPRPVELQGTSVILGETALPLLYSSPTQINAIIPYVLGVNLKHPLVVRKGQRQSAVQQVLLGEAQPAIFTVDASGSGQGHVYVVANNAQTLAGAATPATAGNNIVIYCAGLGAVLPTVAAGVGAPLAPLSWVTRPVELTIGGVRATMQFYGLTPTGTGLYQVNATVPAGVAPGAAVPVVLTVGGVSSPPVTMGVR